MNKYWPILYSIYVVLVYVCNNNASAVIYIMQSRQRSAASTSSAIELTECLSYLNEHGHSGLGPHVGLRIRYSAGEASADSDCADAEDTFDVEVTKQLQFPGCDDNPYLQHVANCFETISRQLGTVCCTSVDTFHIPLYSNIFCTGLFLVLVALDCNDCSIERPGCPHGSEKHRDRDSAKIIRKSFR